MGRVNKHREEKRREEEKKNLMFHLLEGGERNTTRETCSEEKMKQTQRGRGRKQGQAGCVMFYSFARMLKPGAASQRRDHYINKISV